jgi:hypothetical protein
MMFHQLSFRSRLRLYIQGPDLYDLRLRLSSALGASWAPARRGSDKVYNLIDELSLRHSRLVASELDETCGLPQFNMPRELGIFLGAKRYVGAAQKAKRSLVLDVEQYRYQKFVSDLAGVDVHEHSGDPIRALRGINPDDIPYVDFKRIVVGLLLRAKPPE